MSSPEKAIGVFDSGIGGLTVAHAIKTLLPEEQLIYFGDTAHLPYGDKSEDTILTFSRLACRYFIDRECKAMVIACNTASAYAYDHLNKEFGEQILIINVIDPMVDLIERAYSKSRVSVIGTKGTIGSGVYEKKINLKSPNTALHSLATPLLAPMIEEGYFDNAISHHIIEAYLKEDAFQESDALILGCTHYPLIKDEISAFLGKQIDILDSSEITASALKSALENTELLNSGASGKDEFYVSDYTPSFEHASSQFFGKELDLQKLQLNRSL